MQCGQTGFRADENLSPDAAAPALPDGEILSVQRRERQRKPNGLLSGQSVMKNRELRLGPVRCPPLSATEKHSTLHERRTPPGDSHPTALRTVS